jgi:hypothetical protein
MPSSAIRRVGCRNALNAVSAARPVWTNTFASEHIHWDIELLRERLTPRLPRISVVLLGIHRQLEIRDIGHLELELRARGVAECHRQVSAVAARLATHVVIRSLSLASPPNEAAKLAATIPPPSGCALTKPRRRFAVRVLSHCPPTLLFHRHTILYGGSPYARTMNI